MAETAGPNVRQRRVARTLREWRKTTGETLEETATKLRWSVPKLSRFERAEVNAGPAEIIALATILGVDDTQRDAVVALAIASVENAGWWRSYGSDALSGDLADYVETEAEAELVRNVEVTLIPGLLQTVDYAEALIRSWLPKSDVVEAGRVRQQRQARLVAENKPLRLHAIIHESVLRQYIGSAKTMKNQLVHLVEMAGRSNIDLQVLPISCGAYSGFGISYHIIDFAQGDAMAVYLDNLDGGMFIEESDKLDIYGLNFKYLSDLALDHDASVQLITQTLNGWK